METVWESQRTDPFAAFSFSRVRLVILAVTGAALLYTFYFCVRILFSTSDAAEQLGAIDFAMLEAVALALIALVAWSLIAIYLLMPLNRDAYREYLLSGTSTDDQQQ